MVPCGYGGPMTISVPEGAPAWLGWVLFVLAVLTLIAREVVHARAVGADQDKARAETLKIQLDGVRESADGYARQLNAIAEVLAADSAGRPPAVAGVDLESVDSRSARAVAEFQESRMRARTEVPQLIERLLAARRREAELTTDLAQGIDVKPGDVSDLRMTLDAVVASVGHLVEELVAVPRVFVQAHEPSEPRVGDIWLRLGGDET